MHTHDRSAWTHEHVFDEGNLAGERGTRWVVLITGVMMVVEILAGWLFNSMVLLADGWHIFSHAGAISLSALGDQRPRVDAFSRQARPRPARGACPHIGRDQCVPAGGVGQSLIIEAPVPLNWPANARL